VRVDTPKVRLAFRNRPAIELDTEVPVLIGRGLECAVRSDDGMMSRRHAKVFFRNGRWMIEDLNSANGVHVNHERKHVVELHDGDMIAIAGLWMRFENPASRAPRDESLLN